MFIHALHLLVDLFINTKPVIVHRPVLWVRRINSLELHQPGNIRKGNQPQSHCPDPGCAARVGIDRIGNLADLHVHHIRKDLAPDLGLRSAAGDVDGGELAPEKLFHCGQQPAGVESNPFQKRADNILARVLQ